MENTAAKSETDFAASSSAMNTPTSSLVKPRSKRKAATMMDPIMIMGLRLPYLDFDSSAQVPTIGWTMIPDKGPAIQTKEVLLLDRPSARR